MTGVEKIVEDLKNSVEPAKIDPDDFAKFILTQCHDYLAERIGEGRMTAASVIAEAVIKASSYVSSSLVVQVAEQVPFEHLEQAVNEVLDDILLNQGIGNGLLMMRVNAAIDARKAKGV